MTFTELQGRLVKSIRTVRAVYRRADTAGEKLERELDRLVSRKRLIQPNDLLTAGKLFENYSTAVDAIGSAIVDANLAINWESTR